MAAMAITSDGTPRDRTTTRLLGMGLVIGFLALVAAIVAAMTLSYLRPDSGNISEHIPTEVWMVISALIGLIGAYLNVNNKAAGADPQSMADAISTVLKNHTPAIVAAANAVPSGWVPGATPPAPAPVVVAPVEVPAAPAPVVVEPAPAPVVVVAPVEVPVAPAPVVVAPVEVPVAPTPVIVEPAPVIVAPSIPAIVDDGDHLPEIE